MSDLPLHVVSETPTTITLGWNPPAGAEGYVLYVGGVRKSNSWDPNKSTWKIAKPGPYVVDALATLASGDYPPLAPQFGNDLLALFPPPAPPTGPVLKLNSFQELVNAWTNPTEGADYDGQGKTFSGPAGDRFYRLKGQKTTRYRNLKVTGGSRFLTAGSHVALGNTMKEPFQIFGGTPDCLKLDPGSSWVSCDGLILDGATGQGLLTGSGSDPAVTDIRLVNIITRGSGTNTNKDHGAYLAHIKRFLLANWLSVNNHAYNGQVYPQAQDGYIVNATFDGGVTRGGVIYGTESGEPEPTKSVRTIGCISTNAPAGPGYILYNAAPGCTVEDSMAFGNSGGDSSGLPTTNLLHADPRYVNRNAGDYKPQFSVAVRQVNWGWLMPTDLYGNPRGATAGAIAL